MFDPLSQRHDDDILVIGLVMFKLRPLKRKKLLPDGHAFVLSGRGGLRIVDRAAPGNQCIDVTLTPTPTGALAGPSVEAGESRVYREPANIQPRFPCQKVLQPTEANQVSERRRT
jgi:hypothetical protein